jgi:hypothetical protein
VVVVTLVVVDDVVVDVDVEVEVEVDVEVLVVVLRDVLVVLWDITTLAAPWVLKVPVNE